MSRIDDLQGRMIKTMPLPAPVSGPRFGRIRIAAAALAWTYTSGDTETLCHEAQTANAIAQMWMPAKLERIPVYQFDGTPVPADSWDVATSGYWVFQPVTSGVPGAGGPFLDWWGKMLQVPRVPEEIDSTYGQRILSEVISPGITNMGMALLIDTMLGMTGTQVVEADNFFTALTLRLNDLHQLDTGLRLAGILSNQVTDLWNCFLVILPGEIPAGFTPADINRLVDRRRAAGCRKVATITPTRTYSDT